LVDLVRNFGSVHAEKSRLLHGITFEMMAMFGSSVTIDAAAVERFRLALLESGQSRLLKRVFQRDERWTMSPQAATIIKGEKLSDALLAIFSQCEVVRQKSPSLVVSQREWHAAGGSQQCRNRRSAGGSRPNAVHAKGKSLQGEGLSPSRCAHSPFAGQS
jgi:hypothetical protein